MSSETDALLPSSGGGGGRSGSSSLASQELGHALDAGDGGGSSSGYGTTNNDLLHHHPQRQRHHHHHREHERRPTSGASYTSSHEVSFRTSPSSSAYTSCPAAVFLTVNAALGAGLLNMPFAFQSGGGLLLGSLIQLLVVALVAGGLAALTYLTHVSGSQSFQQVVRFFVGPRTEAATSVCIILYSFGACLTFIIIIGDQVDRVLASIYGADFCATWFLSRPFTMTLVSVLLILPLSFSKSIDFLKYSRYVRSCALLLIAMQPSCSDKRDSLAVAAAAAFKSGRFSLFACRHSLTNSPLLLSQSNSSCGVLVVGYILFLACYEWLHIEVDDRLPVHPATPIHRHYAVSKLVPAIVFAYQVSHSFLVAMPCL